MAPPHGDKSAKVKEEAAAAVSSVDNRPISTILFIVAMQTEALPLVKKFQLTEDLNSVFPKGVPWVRFYGNYKGLAINIVCPGKDPALGGIRTPLPSRRVMVASTCAVKIWKFILERHVA